MPPPPEGLIEILEHGHNGEAANMHLFDHSFSSCLGIDDEFVPDAVLDLQFTSISVIEHFIITFNPNGNALN
jgi:hypothetical protein